jgi:histidyl-tRNA synthetase
LYYITPCFRHERPQAGRLRQFHQFGIEALSSKEASIDAEVIGLADMFINSLGIENVELKINSIGCSECRPTYHKELKSFLESKLDKLCPTCNDRYITNPMRILDCKNPTCQDELVEAPVMLDYLCSDCSTHFDSLQSYMNAMDINFIVDPRIVRGLDYYTKTAFEFISGDIGAQSTICGGGRYDGLVEQVGGPATPGVGFGMGIERLLMTLDGCGVEIPKPNSLDVFIISLDDNAIATSLKIAKYLRLNGVSADSDHLKRSMKAQFKYSDKIKARFSIVIGESEIESGTIVLRDMISGEQVTVGMDELIKIVETVKGRV